jgi:hypothetical protein
LRFMVSRKACLFENHFTLSPPGGFGPSHSECVVCNALFGHCFLMEALKSIIT